MIDESKLIHVSTWHDVKNQLIKLFKNIHMKLLSKLSASDKIFLTINYWTSTTCHVFLIITEYFINNVWNYYEILVDFDSFSDFHEKWNLINIIIQTLNKTNLFRHVFFIMIDNVDNNEIMMRFLIKILQKKLNDQ